MERSGSNQWSSPSSDSEFYSVSSPETISPAPSMDRSFSPTHQDRLRRSTSSNSSPAIQGAIKKKRRSRLKNPSEQRQNASEKEKLRMRDLTKALHHLRTYLPPSVAPVGQTLTKIETLRLTIGYISFLSAQLGLSEEELTHRKQVHSGNACQYSSEIVGYFQCRSMAGQWSGQGCGQYDGQYQGGDSSILPGQCTEMTVKQYDGYKEQNLMEQNFTANLENFIPLQQCAQTTQTYQVHGRKFGYQLVPQAYWS
nr:mesoderm posterior ba [Misgurnus anguillicaudatus]